MAIPYSYWAALLFVLALIVVWIYVVLQIAKKSAENATVLQQLAEEEETRRSEAQEPNFISINLRAYRATLRRRQSNLL